MIFYVYGQILFSNTGSLNIILHVTLVLINKHFHLNYITTTNEINKKNMNKNIGPIQNPQYSLQYPPRAPFAVLDTKLIQGYSIA